MYTLSFEYFNIANHSKIYRKFLTVCIELNLDIFSCTKISESA